MSIRKCPGLKMSQAAVIEVILSPSTGRDMSFYSPTEVTFREELCKLREKFPDHILSNV